MSIVFRHEWFGPKRMAKVSAKRALLPHSLLMRCSSRGVLNLGRVKRIKEKLRFSKGMLVNIPATYTAWRWRWVKRGEGATSFSFSLFSNAVTQRVLGDARGRDGEYLLFLLTIFNILWIGLTRDQVIRLEERVSWLFYNHSTRPSLAWEPLKTYLALCGWVRGIHFLFTHLYGFVYGRTINRNRSPRWTASSAAG